MQLSDFDFEFPRELIATQPISRGDSRMLVVRRGGNDSPIHDFTRNFHHYLQPGDALVLNDTRVIPARLRGHVTTGAKAELLLLKPAERVKGAWETLIHSSNPCRPGAKLKFTAGMEGEILPAEKTGPKMIFFNLSEAEVLRYLDEYGEMPIPPYMGRKGDPIDKERYQSVVAQHAGSVAAPTASLHFSKSHLDQIQKVGVKIVFVTLHVGLGTFEPVQAARIEDHYMHSEWYNLDGKTAGILDGIVYGGGRVVAMGTTAARVLETCASKEKGGKLMPGMGWTNCFITPGYQWRVVNALLTNFHWPKSTLFMLVSSLLGTQQARNLYLQAMERKYRLFSYGDAMFIC